MNTSTYTQNLRHLEHCDTATTHTHTHTLSLSLTYTHSTSITTHRHHLPSTAAVVAIETNKYHKPHTGGNFKCNICPHKQLQQLMQHTSGRKSWLASTTSTSRNRARGGTTQNAGGGAGRTHGASAARRLHRDTAIHTHTRTHARMYTHACTRTHAHTQTRMHARTRRHGAHRRGEHAL